MPPKKAAATKAAKAAPAAKSAPSTKRKASSESQDEPQTKKTRVVKSAPKKAVAPKKAATPKKAAPAPKPVAAPKKAPATKKETVAAPKKAVAAKKEAAALKPKAGRPAAVKAAPVINEIPTKRLDIFVFGEGSAGELGLGAKKYDGGKKPVDVKRPRINHLLPAKAVGVVQLAVGGMHCAALTHDNKILTWGVNDQGALGREAPQEGKLKDLPQGDDSDSDSDDEGEGLNPTEAEPRPIDPEHFPEGTKFAQLVASDSATFVVTDTGLVYGWGTFRGNDGILGFREGVSAQRTPALIPELKNIVSLAAGTNHILALNNKGKVFAWGAGEQSQLARRVVSRTAIGALIPREFGLQRKNITKIGCGDYHSFAVAKSGEVYSWGLNTFGQTGIPKDESGENETITSPKAVESLEGFDIKQIVGGAHHSLSITNSGQVLVWGRVDNAQGGMELSDFNQDDLFLDENNRPRFLKKPTVLPNINGEFAAAAPDSCIVVTKEGQAYSWGFSANYQTGQGTLDEVKVATLLDNSALKDAKLVWCGAGGQFSVLAGLAGGAPKTNGI